MSTSFEPPPVQPPDYPGEQYQPPQPNFQRKKILSTPARIILAIVGAVAVLLVIGLMAASANHSSPYAQGLAFDPGDTAAVIGGPQTLVNWLTANDPYDMSTQGGTQWALGAEVAYEQRVLIGDPANDGTTITSVVVDPATVTLSSDGLSFQAVLTFSDGTSQTSAVTDPLTGWNQGVYGASWSSAPAPADTQAATPSASASTPAAAAPATSGSTSQSGADPAAEQQAQTDLSTVQGISFSSDLAALRRDVQVTTSDAATLIADVAAGPGVPGECANSSAINNEAAKLFGAFGNGDESSASSDTTTLQQDISTARSDISALQNDVAGLQSTGSPVPPGMQAAITSAQNAISQAVTTGNADIDQENALVNQALQVDNSLNTPSDQCAIAIQVYGPGPPIAHVG